MCSNDRKFSAIVQVLALKRFISLLLALVLSFWFIQAIAGAYDDVIEAIKRNDVITVRQLIARGVSPDTVDAKGNTLLIIAAREGSIDIVRHLISSHSSISAVNAVGEDAMMHAAIQGHLEIVRYLLVQGADPNKPGWNALIYAAVKGDVRIARLLLAYGAAIDATAPNGLTALMMAARDGHTELVGFLLANHANAMTDAGMGALAMARKADFPAIVAMLIKAGAK
jgi:uncharacterized protein